MAQELKEYITVREYSEFVGRTNQYIYKLIADGMVSAVKFRRGKMSGWLVEKPAGFDEWYQQNK